MDPESPRTVQASPRRGPDRGLVREQLERMLTDPLFKHSRRFPTFLRYIVERTMEGDTADLKERTLGVAVFGRNPTYDTSTDPIVRATASEVRRRLAQYYQAPGHEHELRIGLSPGSYIPEFSLPPARGPSEVPTWEGPRRNHGWRRRRTTLMLAAAAILLSVAFW